MSENKPLYGMFNAIPESYDLVNHVITWGFDTRWRQLAAKVCLAAGPSNVLDLCCGTGDLAIAMLRMAKHYVQITALDFSPEMLQVASRKAGLLPGKDRITFTRAEAVSLPFANGYFDCIGISFAFRNLIYKNPLARLHIAEIIRVLSKGGKLVIVETSQPKSEFVRRLFHLYLRWFVARVGYLLSGNQGAYQYLAESTARFYTPDDLKEMLTAAGFRKVSFKPLFNGVAGLIIALK